MDCIAHRGFAGVNPENTVPAVRRAVSAGADAIEVDVRRCGSGELVVVHDPTVDRVTGATGAVADYSLAELAGLSVLDSAAGIPSLADVLATAGDTRLNVELKEVGVAADALAAVDRHGVEAVFSAFDPAALAPVAGEVPSALLFADRPAAALDRAAELGCDAVHPHHALCEPAFVARAEDAGFAVNAWTVDSTTVAEKLTAAGVDGLIADAPAYCPCQTRDG